MCMCLQPAALQPYASRANSLQPSLPTHAFASAAVSFLEAATQAAPKALFHGLSLP